MNKALAILNGFIHDFAAGLWAATVLAVWWLERAAGQNPGVAQVLEDLQRNFFWIGIASTLVVFATGAGRGFTYAIGVYGPEAEPRRRRMLLWKHVGLVGIFGVGTVWQHSLAFR